MLRDVEGAIPYDYLVHFPLNATAPKEAKKGPFSNVLSISTVATVDLGRCPKNPQTFEKV